VWAARSAADLHHITGRDGSSFRTAYNRFFRSPLKIDGSIDGRLQPPEVWDVLRGFLLAAMQTDASICILLSDRRPKPLMLHAGILNRSLFEIQGSGIRCARGSCTASAHAPARVAQGTGDAVSIPEGTLGQR
jgi:hypothetical protein